MADKPRPPDANKPVSGVTIGNVEGGITGSIIAGGDVTIGGASPQPNKPSAPTEVSPISLDEMFREAAHYQVKGDLGYALQLYRQLRQTAPTYPRIDAAISAVEKEMQAPYVNGFGVVQKEHIVQHYFGYVFCRTTTLLHGLSHESLWNALLVSSIIIQWLGYLVLLLIREPVWHVATGMVCYPVIFGPLALSGFVFGVVRRSKRIIVLSLLAGLSMVGIFALTIVLGYLAHLAGMNK